jgi:hypothetical protein
MPADLGWARVLPDGSPAGSAATLELPSDDRGPAAASDGDGFLAAWLACTPQCCFGQEECMEDEMQILALRLDASGDPQDAAPLVLGTTPGTLGLPSVASDGNRYLAVWDVDTGGVDGLAGVFVGPTGERAPVPALAGSIVGPGHRSPDVSYDGSVYWLVWREMGARQSWDLHAVRIDRGGNPLDASDLVLSAEATSEGRAALAALSSERTLVAYSRLDPFPTFGSVRVRARLVEQPADAGPDGGDDEGADGAVTDDAGSGEADGEGSSPDGVGDTDGGGSSDGDAGVPPPGDRDGGCTCAVAVRKDGAGARWAVVFLLCALPVVRLAVRRR